jgi:zona occludens toxin
MITLLTGLPGNGKTLFALWYIKKKAERENRPVYYHNIRDLTLPWTAHDPEKWQDLPAGSIMVIDEAQQVFPKLGNGAKRPDHYEKLATHRHLGIDLFIITQTPALVDLFVRELVGQHFNSVRKFGLERSSIYEWSKVTMSPGSPAAMKSAIPLKWAYPKEVYGYYTSAEVHTVKKSIPLKLILAAAFVVAVPVTGYFVLDWWQKKNSVPPDVVPVAQQGQVASSAPGLSSSVSGYGSANRKEEFDPLVDARIYVQQNTPRVPGLPQTAPRYDELTVPTRVPVPAACIQVGVAREGKPAPRCKCFTQAGTPMEVEYNMCISIAQNGYFLDFEPDARRQQQQAQAQRAERSVEVLSDRPDSGSYSRQASTVVAFSSPSVGGSPPVVQVPSGEAPRARRAIVGSVQ